MASISFHESEFKFAVYSAPTTFKPLRNYDCASFFYLLYDPLRSALINVFLCCDSRPTNALKIVSFLVAARRTTLYLHKLIASESVCPKGSFGLVPRDAPYPHPQSLNHHKNEIGDSREP